MSITREALLAECQAHADLRDRHLSNAAQLATQRTEEIAKAQSAEGARAQTGRSRRGGLTMPRVRIISPAGLFHRASGFHQADGEHDFPDDPRFAGWLAGMCEQGVCELVAAAAAPVKPPVSAMPPPTTKRGR